MKALKMISLMAATTLVLITGVAEARGPGGGGAGGGSHYGGGSGMGNSQSGGQGQMKRQDGGQGQGDQMRTQTRDPALNPGHEPTRARSRDRDQLQAPATPTTN